MPNELVALGGAFLAAGLAARVGRRVGMPTIPFFILAGIATGPHTPGLVLVREPDDMSLFAMIGLIMLLLHLGLEFSLEDLTRGGGRLLAAGGVRLALHVGGGLALGATLGWGGREAFVIAGAVGISSSAIVTKLLIELRRLANPETPVILGVIIVEDVFLAFYLALLQPVLGGAQGIAETVAGLARALTFLVVLAAVARFVPWMFGRLVDAEEDDLTTVLFVGLAILVAGLGEEIGVSAAIGALLVGLILARTTVADRIRSLAIPMRDAFGAVFFFAFGLTIDPEGFPAVWPAVTAAAAGTVVLSLVAGWIASIIYRLDRQAAWSTGLTHIGRGEFSLIVATMAAGAGLDRRITPFVALYVLVLALLGPLLTSRSTTFASLSRTVRAART